MPIINNIISYIKGRHTSEERGLYRLHQFTKVNLIYYVHTSTNLQV